MLDEDYDLLPIKNRIFMESGTTPFRPIKWRNCSVNTEEVIRELKVLADPRAAAGMARFGIHINNVIGISIPHLRRLARSLGKDHALAQELWASGIHEARILAAYIDEPRLVTGRQMEDWVKEFDSWDVCDQVCSNLFDKTSYAYVKAVEWSEREEEFVKRAGFVLMAVLAVHDKPADDKEFLRFLEIIREKAGDDRNFVKKAVNWALRQIGKRNRALNRAAVSVAEDVYRSGTKAAKWIATDAIRELKGDGIQRRL